MLVPVIISGGAGTRLWPVSRESRPKPFMQVKDGLTLLQSTLLRSVAVADGEIMLVTNRDYYFQSREQLDALGQRLGGVRGSFLLEPVGRNTTAAVAMSAFAASERHGPGTLLLVLPADHLVEDQASFERAVAAAKPAAVQGDFVTFGIVPTGPEIGYGYIECAGAWKQGVAGVAKRFVEKPDFARARAFIESGSYLWNSGMFCFRADAILAGIEKHAPDIFQKVRASWQRSRASDATGAVNIDDTTFSQVPAISIDYAVMERADNVKVIPSDFGWSDFGWSDFGWSDFGWSDFGWSDIGSWRSISELVAPDEQGNKVVGDAVLVQARNTYVQGEGRMIAAVGVENLIVVDTPDALLIGHRDKTQLVKDVVEKLRMDGHESAKWHRTVYRPWGTYTVLEEGPHYKMKRIIVKPGASLSLQLHKHSSEHWVVIAGTAVVMDGEQTLTLGRGESIHIPTGHEHCLSNSTTADLMIIAVQTGTCLDGGDIESPEGIYGR